MDSSEMKTPAHASTDRTARPPLAAHTYRRLADIIAMDLTQSPRRYQGVRLECAGMQPDHVDALREVVSQTLAALRPTQTVEMGNASTFADLEDEAGRRGYNGNRCDPLWIIVLRETCGRSIIEPGSIFSTFPLAGGPDAFRPELFYSVNVAEFLQYVR